jgi:hypothetical protein
MNGKGIDFGIKFVKYDEHCIEMVATLVKLSLWYKLMKNRFMAMLTLSLFVIGTASACVVKKHVPPGQIKKELTPGHQKKHK